MIIRHDRNDHDYRELAREHKAVCCLNAPRTAKGVGVLIHPFFVLTAAHGVHRLPEGHQILLAAVPRTIRALHVHPSWEHKPARPSLSDGTNFADIAILQLARPVEDVAPLPLYERADEQGKIVTLVGNGAFGTGLSEEKLHDYEWRAATNRVETVKGDAWLILRFDEPEQATNFEGVGGAGDSGSPALIQLDNQWHVAGVASWEDSSEATGRGMYGVKKHYFRTSAALAWIQFVVTSIALP